MDRRCLLFYLSINFHITLLLISQWMSFENLSTIRIILGACGTQTDAIEESFKMLMTQSLSSANFAIIPGRALVGTSLGIKKNEKSRS